MFNQHKTDCTIGETGFEDVMPDDRKYLRFLPRAGKSVSLTVGNPITSKIVPLVEEWRRLVDLAAAAAGGGGDPEALTGGRGGSWSAHDPESAHIESMLPHVHDAETRLSLANAHPERRARMTGHLVEKKQEESIRKRICEVLTDELQALGIAVEEKEGKDGRQWRNAVQVDPR